MPISTLDIHEFTHPLEAVPAMATMDAQTFLAQLNRVLTTAGRDDALPTLTGVQMTLDGETLTMAATDRYRFAVAEVSAPRHDPAAREAAHHPHLCRRAGPAGQGVTAASRGRERSLPARRNRTIPPCVRASDS
ncbi:hypothetical protein [Streptomyces sp. ok210]|uniref:DNA polymerase III subunit beta family protein n=1 Tax=Streptomyces sp. ok210 TaxID=1761905 RepID=UPI0008EB9963|nr:DNA polymerase III beta subunit, central domain [Streptomyces sp. ok210]